MLEQVEIRRSKRARHVSLKVDAFGNVVVVIPTRLRNICPKSIVDEHRAWIDRKIVKLKNNRLVKTEEDGLLPKRVSLQGIGEEFVVQAKLSANGRRTREMQGVLNLELKDMNQSPELLKNWLQKKARMNLEPWLNRRSLETGFAYNRVSIRGQRTRWGSCTVQGNISLNRNLLFLPQELIHYLLLHELCHTRHLNHSRAYWSLVQSFEPDYQRLEYELTHANRYVPLWAI